MVSHFCNSSLVAIKEPVFDLWGHLKSIKECSFNTAIKRKRELDEDASLCSTFGSLELSRKKVPIESLMKKLCLSDDHLPTHASASLPTDPTGPTCPTVPTCPTLPSLCLPTRPTIQDPAPADAPKPSTPLQKTLIVPSCTSKLFDGPESLEQAYGNLEDKSGASECLQDAKSSDA